VYLLRFTRPQPNPVNRVNYGITRRGKAREHKHILSAHCCTDVTGHFKLLEYVFKVDSITVGYLE
jgi:hypothetical protein